MPFHSHNLARIPLIVEKAKAGMTLQEIGNEFGVTRERIRQILNKCGVPITHRCRNARNLSFAEHKAAQLHAKRDLWAMGRYGCTYEVLLALNGQVKTKVKGCLAFAYINQQRAAEWRGIGFEMTFPQWVQVWRDSGRLAQRGRGHGKYVMSRFGDKGDYRIGNVLIQLADQNTSEGTKRAHRRRMATRVSENVQVANVS